MTSPDVVERARELVAKLDECAPHMRNQAVWMHTHGMHYNGPQYGEALEALRRSLASIPLVETQAGVVDRLESALLEARRVVQSDAEACRAFAGHGETSEPERVLGVIDAALEASK